MTQQELNKILRKHRLWLYGHKDGIKADLRRADLRKANLYGADLYEVSLYEANLYGADLYEVSLYEANLYGADLRIANLYGVNLSGANLYGANLCGAKGILIFNGEEHQLIYYKYNNEYRVKVGCIDQPLDFMLENFESIGKENGYSKETIKLYGDVIKLFSQYELKGGV